MQQPTPIEYAYQLIQHHQIDDARRYLASILAADPTDAAAWSLSAWIAPDAERCTFALRQVMTLGGDGPLAQWARRGIALVEHTGTLDEAEPPLWRPARPAAASAPKKKEPEVRGPGYLMRQLGGGIVIIGVFIIILALVLKPVFDLLAATGIAPGWYGIVVILIGALVIRAGYAADK